MVAYNFKSQFAPLVQSGQKRQTIRADRQGRSRHVRPGETLQLYTGMRTRNCRKLVEPDPVCVAVRSVWFPSPAIVVDGRLLTTQQIKELARLDGFSDVADFYQFFRETHGFPFKGVLIKW